MDVVYTGRLLLDLITSHPQSARRSGTVAYGSENAVREGSATGDDEEGDENSWRMCGVEV
jgi:hypothetical protein